MWLQKAHCNESSASVSATRIVTADTQAVASLVRVPTLWWMLYTAGVASVLWVWGKPHSEPPWQCEAEGSEGGCFKAKVRTQNKVRCHRSACNYFISAADPSEEQMDLGMERIHIVCGRRVFKATTT